jgi:sugar transferase (PEP-CTERM/EpsH1 system associated)
MEAGGEHEAVGRTMNVLFVTTRFPAPPWRGDQVRAYHHLRLLGRRHRITLAALVWRPPTAAARTEIEGFGVRVEIVPLGLAGGVGSIARVLAGDRRPLQVLLYARARAAARIARLMAAEPFDVAHLQLVRAAPYLPEPPGPPAVVDLVDALSANMRLRARLERGPVGPIAAWESARLRRFETALLARAAACLVVTEAEREAVGGAARVVPNGVDAEAFPYREGERTPGRIVFAGNLGYFPNVDAARWLATDIFPRIRAEVPGAELRLIGARPASALRRLAAAPGVSLAASVPAMAPELGSAAVAVIPMRAGTGVQNKVLEAMAAGAPVVTTPRAAAALAGRDGEHFLVAEDAAGLASATVALLRDPPRARALARAARALVERRYRWEGSADGVEAAWEAARRASPFA